MTTKPPAPHTGSPLPDSGKLAERLVGRVREHLELARALDKLSQAQGISVRGADTAATLDTLAQRQPLIDRLTQLNDELAPLVAGLTAGRGPGADAAAALSPAQRVDLLADLREIDRLMSAIAQRDREDEAALAAQRAAVAQQLSSVLTGADALAAYGQLARPDQGQSHFQDRQG